MDNLWRIVHVKSNCEKKAAIHLTARSIENYLPLVLQMAQWTDRTVMSSRPLFPGYIFVRTTLVQRLSVLTTPDVAENGLGEAIPQRELEQIRTASDQGYKLEPQFGRVKGSRVRFRKGVFSGTEGIAVPCGDAVKVVVGLSGCEQLFSVESDLDALDVVDQHVS